MAFKERSALLDKIPGWDGRRIGDHCDGFSVRVLEHAGWGRELTFFYFLFSYWRYERVYRKGARGFFGGVENKDSVCNLMPSGGSQLAFRALRFQCATDQKWAWSVSRQNTHRNHFKEAWIMHEALRSCSGLTCWHVTGDLCIGSVVVWWCFLAVWQGVMFPGLQEDMEIESRPTSLARAAQHIENIVVQS